mgnify:CR=1 FL=1
MTVATWESLVADSSYSEIARRLIADCTSFDFDALRDNTFATLATSPELTVIVEDAMPDDGCGGGGYYRPEPPTIYLHPSIWRRDNFTLLHELGHHLQIRHPDWIFILLDLPAFARRTVEEAVCDSVAAEVLMPWNDADNLDAWWRCHPADVMAGLFHRHGASRSAVLQRVLGKMPTPAKWILAVADLDGTVQTSQTTYSDLPPAKGVVQHGFAELAREAEKGPVRRLFTEGVEYRSGQLLDDMNAEAVLDHDRRYVFIALTPTNRFGTGTIVFPTFECANPACGETFGTTTAGSRCTKCSEPHCPHCGRCSCPSATVGTICPSCSMLLSAGEVLNGTHECW